MLKRFGPLITVAVFSLSLGFSQSLFADPEDDAEEAADTTAGLVINDVLEISQAVLDGSSVGIYSTVVSLMVNDDVRLISERRPLSLLLGGAGSKPHGAEKNLLADAIASEAEQSVIDGNTFVKVYPLPDNVHAGCATCHTDFGGTGEISGALVIRAPIE